MPRFYFHIRDHDDYIRDEEGIELSGPKVAMQEAEDAAREMLAERVRRNQVINGHQFEVHDELGMKLFTIPFKSILKLV